MGIFTHTPEMEALRVKINALISSANNTYLFVCLRQCMYII